MLMTRTKALGYCMVIFMVIAAGVAITGWANFWHLRQEVNQACHGTVAALDLTDWVTICKGRQ